MARGSSRRRVLRSASATHPAGTVRPIHVFANVTRFVRLQQVLAIALGASRLDRLGIPETVHARSASQCPPE